MLVPRANDPNRKTELPKAIERAAQVEQSRGLGERMVGGAVQNLKNMIGDAKDKPRTEKDKRDAKKY